MASSPRSMRFSATGFVCMMVVPAILMGCIDRPIGAQQPKTTSLIVDALRQGGVYKIDLLFMIDNSMSMEDKQSLLAQALPDLVNRLVDPVCVADDGGTTTAAVNGQCSPGFTREFKPIDDIHIGVITSSLGGFGSEADCKDAALGQTDNAHLLGSLARVRSTLTTTPEFLGWCRPGSDAELRGECLATPETNGGDAVKFTDVFAEQVKAARQGGCGWEASLEAWYRFLVDPKPWTSVERQDCPGGSDMSALCIGPKRDSESGEPEVDSILLQQRAAFLRPDSLLAIVMLTDENDCSFKATGQSWLLAQALKLEEDGDVVHSAARRGSAACQTDPNSACCVSCGANIPEGCPTGVDEKGRTVSEGCEEPFYPEDLGLELPAEDPINLRCFAQKRRFGVDYLYPVSRYSNALKLETICPYADDLDPLAQWSDGSLVCGPNQELAVRNPLYTDLTYEARVTANPSSVPIPARTSDLVFLAGIVGVPWQDIAVDPNAPTLEYRTNDASKPNPIDWVQLLGSAQVGAPYDLLRAPPTDPLMREQIEPRTGTDASVNGGEWNILDGTDLQYACTFPLDVPKECPDPDDLVSGETAPCDCTYYGDPSYENPLCDGLTQKSAKAYPSIRPLQVLRDYGPNSIVASICPKNTTDASSPDYGYRPAMAAIIDRLKDPLAEKCLDRGLEVKAVEGGMQASCVIVEADPQGNGCDAARARSEVGGEIARKVYERLVNTSICTEADCQRYQLCGIQPLKPGTAEYESCLSEENPSGDGWCYVDPGQGLGEQHLVDTCGDSEQRKVRFAGAANPRKGTTTFFACAGAPQ